MHYIIRTLKYAKPYIKIMTLSVIVSVIYGATNTMLAPLSRDLIKAIEKIDTKFGLFTLYVGYIVVIRLVSMACKVFQGYFMPKASGRIIIDMQMELYQKLQKLSMDFYKKWHVGDIMARVFGDVGALQNIIKENFTTIIPESITLLGAMGYAVYTNWKLALMTFIALPIMIFTINWFAQKMKKLTGKIARKGSDINSLIQEVLSSIFIVKSFTSEDYELARFSKHAEKSYRYSMRSVIYSALQKPVLELMQFIAIVLVIWYGGYLVSIGEVSGAELVSFFVAIMVMVNPIIALSGIYNKNVQATVAARRIYKLLDMEVTIKDPVEPKILENTKGKVELQHVSFRYPNGDGDVLKKVSLLVNPGEIIALVGASGAGKTTLVNMIPRFFDVTEGSVKIDDVDIREYSVYSLRKNVGIVPQEAILFSGSVRENIAYGRQDATMEEIEDAAKQANAYDFIKQMPNGFYTRVGSRGTRLSGGQRQRIAIARAILRNSKILILDEATSALDTESERIVQDALYKLMEGRTSFVIAHRLSTIVHADRIVAMQHGEIVEIGTHDELLAKGGYYKKLYSMQFEKQVDHFYG